MLLYGVFQWYATYSLGGYGLVWHRAGELSMAGVLRLKVGDPLLLIYNSEGENSQTIDFSPPLNLLY